MKIGANGLALVKHFEQCRLQAFKPVATDPWTIGWGRTGGVSEGQTCTQEEADTMLAHDLSAAESAVNQGVTHPISQNMFDALVSFTYNCGEGAFLASTLRRMVNDGHFVAAADQFARWNKSAGVELAGLTRRREAERRLFGTPDGEPFEVTV